MAPVSIATFPLLAHITRKGEAPADADAFKDEKDK